MAKINELVEPAWSDWLRTRPKTVQDLAAQLPPDCLYRLKETGQPVTIRSYLEDGTVTVNVPDGYYVFGITPDDLEECDLSALH